VTVDGAPTTCRSLSQCLRHRYRLVEFDFALRITPDAASVTPMLAAPFMALVQRITALFESTK
jgi:hypothetical protein